MFRDIVNLQLKTQHFQGLVQEKELFVEALMFTCQGILGTAPLELTLFWIVMTLTMRRMRLLQDKRAELNLRQT